MYLQYFVLTLLPFQSVASQSADDDNIMDLIQRHIIFHYHDQKVLTNSKLYPLFGVPALL